MNSHNENVDYVSIPRSEYNQLLIIKREYETQLQNEHQRLVEEMNKVGLNSILSTIGQCQRAKIEVDLLKHRGWWDRLWNK